MQVDSQSQQKYFVNMASLTRWADQATFTKSSRCVQLVMAQIRTWPFLWSDCSMTMTVALAVVFQYTNDMEYATGTACMPALQTVTDSTKRRSL